MKNKNKIQQNESTSLGRIWTLLIDRFKVTTLIVLFIFVYGIRSFVALPREVTPQIEIPAASITTVWPGASPGDMEKLVTGKIEKEIKSLENVEEYTSVSLSGVSVVSIEFDIDSDMTDNMQKLREKLDTAENDLPASLPDDPDLREASFSDIPIVSLTLSGDFSWSELKQFAETLEDEFESVPKVKEASVKGAPEDEVHILLDPIALQAHRVGVDEVISAIRASHRDMPLGQVAISGQKVEVTVRSELETASEFMEVPIKLRDGTLLKLGDFAEVRREFEKFEVETYFTTRDSSQPAVLIDVIKSASKGNVITMVSEVLARVEHLKLTGAIPRSLHTDVTYNRADDIKESLNTLTHSGLQTLILIAFVMFLALGWRESALASLSIPLSLLGAIIFLYVRGDTFNGISLFALVISVGLLVDNSIIVTEGISSGIHDEKKSPRDAALSTIRTFRWPIITGTLTTMFAFLPMLFFVSGVSGQYISILPITVITVLVVALFVSLWLLPALGTHFFKIFPPKLHRESKTLHRVQEWYEKQMKRILASPKKIKTTLGLSLLAFLSSIGLVLFRLVPIEVFPSSDQTFFAVELELPKGSRLEETRKIVEPVEQAFAKFFIPREDGEIWLKNIVFTVGQKSSAVTDFDDVARLSEENVLGISINLTEKEARETPSYNIVPVMRKTLEEVVPSHVEIRFSELQGGPPTGAPIEIRILGENLGRLEEMAEVLQLQLKEMPHTENVRDSRADRVTQLTWRFDRDILMRFGLTPAQILETLRSAVNGTTVVRLTEGDKEVDVDVRIDWEGDKKWDDPQSLEYLNTIPLLTPSGSFVTLSQVAFPEISSELSSVQHRNGLRTIFVRSDTEKGYPASKMEPDIKEAIGNLSLRPGEIVEIGGENEEGRKLMREMGESMLFALLLIFLVLVWQFNSFTQPLAILVLIPLSLTAVFFGFWLTQMTISFPTMIGIVSLAGIIVNDAIVLIDRINQNIASGMEHIQASIIAGKERMQPIFLTSLTTVVGMLPLSLSDEVWGGLGFAIVYGMAFSTVLTLLLTPCFLAVLHRKA
ncbi:efflux RND transporter permease subunit [Candidatus Gracilibacteria bacterium]|nr:efflux RND transporter permease subunit [Candidatus Gracilibacteria bacterium]